MAPSVTNATRWQNMMLAAIYTHAALLKRQKPRRDLRTRFRGGEVSISAVAAYIAMGARLVGDGGAAAEPGAPPTLARWSSFTKRGKKS